jgi:hypothetical protein
MPGASLANWLDDWSTGAAAPVTAARFYGLLPAPSALSMLEVSESESPESVSVSESSSTGFFAGC